LHASLQATAENEITRMPASGERKSIVDDRNRFQ
jgi:hypothetical protein